MGDPSEWLREAWRSLRNDASRPNKTFVHGAIAMAEHLGALTAEQAELWTRRLDTIHMPRWASRLTLEIASVRVERVQAISEEDARAEGVTLDDAIREKVPTCRDVFRYRWDAVNGRRAGCSWRDNPHVWRLSFRRVEA